MGCHEGSWTAMGGHGGPWEVMGDHGRSWMVIGRSWKAMGGHLPISVTCEYDVRNIEMARGKEPPAPGVEYL